MRIFIAIDCPKEVKDYLFKLQKEIHFEKKFNKIKWVAKKNLHLTLRFLGDISEQDLEKTINNLKNLKEKSFEAKLQGTGLFPHEDFPRVVWLGLTPKNKITKFQQKIDEATLGIGKSEQEFSAHITLGRVKQLRKKEEYIKQLKETEIKPLSFPINKITVFQSILTKDGPKYRVKEEITLA